MNIRRLICRVLAALMICSGAIYPIATSAWAADLVNVTDTLSDYAAGHTANHTVSFTTATLMPKTGKIIITFSGFDVNLAGLGTATIGGISSPFSLSKNDQIATLNPNAPADISAGTLISIQLIGIISPLTPGIYPLTITTTQPNGTTTIDTGNSTISIVPSGMSTTNVVPSTSPSVYGQSVNFTATVTPPGATGTVQFRIDGTDFGSPVELSGGTAVSSSITALSAGNHNISAVYSGDTNYASSTGNVTQTVNKGTPIITWNNPADITYPTPLSAEQLNATASIPGSFVYDPPAGTILNVGSNQALNVTFFPTDSANYNQAAATVHINVLQTGTTITISNLNQTYDGSPKSATVTTNPVGLSYSITYDGSATSPTNAGSYNVVATITDPNYSGSASGSLVISPAPLTITADAKTKTYGQSDPVLTYQITSGTLFGIDTLNGSLTRESGEEVGTYAILLGTVTASNNYILTFIGANFTITNNSAVITLDNLNHTYDRTAKSASVTTSPLGLSYSITYNGSSTPPVNAGNYTVVVTITDPNYQGTANGTLTISQAALTITANSQTKVYGQTNPALTYQITSGTLIAGDAITGALTRTAGENVGTYAIQKGTLTAGSNYTISFIGANLSITKAGLMVRANNATRAFGEPNPTFTVSYSGFVNSDDSSDLSGAPQLSTAATQTSPVGTYVISIAQGNLSSPNYTFTLIDGTLTIGSNVITVTSNPQSKIYGDPDPVLTYSAPDGISFTGTLERTAGENVGSYAINQGTLSAGPDYTINFIVANLTIIKATPVITWANPADITYPAALSDTQLNAISSTEGTFVYIPAAGTILNVGNNQSLQVDFMPSDIVNYNTTSKSVSVNVLSAAPAGGGGDLGGSVDSSGGGGGGGSSDRTYLNSYMKETPGVFSEDVSLKAWDGICNLLISKDTQAKTAEGWAVSYITFEPVPADKQALPPPTDGNIIGTTYSLGPEGTTFDPPITMSLLYFPEKLPAGVNENDLVIGYWNPTSEQWEPLSDSKIDTVNHTIKAPLSHFSNYSILSIPKVPASPKITETPKFSPAEFPAENANKPSRETIITPPPIDEPQVPVESPIVKPSLSPALFVLTPPVFPSSRVAPGQKVDINVLIANQGELGGNYALVLKVNGTVKETRDVTVPGRSNETVIFTFSQNQSGKYLVEINGFSGIIEIPSYLPGWLLPVSIGLAALVFGLTILFVLRKSSRVRLQLT